VTAAAIRRRRERARIPDHVRHSEKWRLALGREIIPAGVGYEPWQ
jgi:hypothetical protein